MARVAFVLISLCLSAACLVSAPSAVEAEREVRAVLDTFFREAAAKNWVALSTLLADDFEFFGDDAVVVGRAEFLKAMQDDSMDIESLQLADVKVTASRGADLAIAKYRLNLRSSVQGKPYNMTSVETIGFRRESGNWRLVHNHASIQKASASAEP
jgi:ketosteroid isomerase-like protein